MRVLTADDVPGINDAGVKHDEPLFPDEVMFVGHAVCWVLGETLEAARLGAAAVEVDYEPLPAIVGARPRRSRPRASRAASPSSRAATSTPALAGAAHVFSGVTEMAGQEHFYLETHCLARAGRRGRPGVRAEQHPAPHRDAGDRRPRARPASHDVTVQCLRMGGGFGGKEMQPHGFAAIAALGAVLTGRPVRLRLNRTQDMTMTGKRHGFHAQWRVGFDDDGRLTALEATLTSDGGWSLDLSASRCWPGRCATSTTPTGSRTSACTAGSRRTHKTSQTAFRGFGGPQGMLVVEDILGRCAPLLGIDPVDLRRRNFYVDGPGHALRPGGAASRAAGAALGAGARRPATSRGGGARSRRSTPPTRTPSAALAVTPVKFGISFNFTAFNQAGALVHVYKDGSVLINHGGTEMGQGLHTKMLQVAATTLGVPLDRVRLAPTRTDKVPNTSATAASSGADLNGGAVKDACEQVLAPPAARCDAGARACPGTSWCARRTSAACSCGRPASTAPRACTGTPRPCRATRSSTSPTASPPPRSRSTASPAPTAPARVDIVHDVGDSLSPLVDLGQIEGGFVQGAGWLTLEDLRWDESDGPDRGRLATQAASTYKLPSFSRDARGASASRCSSAPTRTARSTAPRRSASRR